jgi:phosphoribosylaminoimidazolecarboxamide formyltransferase / IMP cyclohydrolase
MARKRAIISVWDKTGIIGLARVLDRAGYEILSTSKTAAAIRDAGVPVTEIADYTGSPEILGGRVKTLHPKIAGGILTTREDDTVDPIDVVVCNLYAFEEGLGRGATHQELVELIDIGGVTLLRAAAKNHAFVTAVPGPEHYPAVIAELSSRGTVGDALRLKLAALAFEQTSRYDTAIARHFASEAGK